MTSSRPPGATGRAVRAMAACRAALVSACSEYLGYEVECAGPGLWWRQQVGDQVFHTGTREAPPGAGDRGR
jgi:hypothetical protein